MRAEPLRREKRGEKAAFWSGVDFQCIVFFFQSVAAAAREQRGGRLEREPCDSLPSLALSRGDTEGSLLDAGAVVIELLVSPGCLLFSIQN